MAKRRNSKTRAQRNESQRAANQKVSPYEVAGTVDDGAAPNGGRTVERTQVRTVSYAGPLPQPDALARYDEIVPGAAERIIQLAERHAAHTQRLEDRAIEYTRDDVRRGQWMGFWLVIIILAICVWEASRGDEALAAVLGGTTLASVAAVFVVGRLKKGNDPTSDKR